MKKRILSIVLAFAMVVAFMPATAFAAQTDFHIDKPTMKSHMGRYLIYNPKVTTVNGVTDQMTYYKQACRDMLHETWNEVVASRSSYCDEVWNEMNTCYNQEVERINNATKLSEIMVPVMGFMLAYAPGESVDLMRTLSEYTTNVYNSPADLPKLTKDYNVKASAVINSLSRSDFNDYYLTVLDACEDKYNSDKQNVASLMDFINMKAAFESILGSYMEEADDDDFYWDDEEDDDVISSQDDDDPLLPYYVSKFAPYELYKGICTKAELDEIKSEAKLYLDNYYLRQLPMAGYDDTSAIDKLYSDAISKVKDASSLDQIGSTVSNAVEEMIVETGVKYELSSEGYLENVIAEINAYLQNFNPSDYSEEKLMEISNLQDELDDILSSATYKAETYQVSDDFKVAFEKIPNKAQELKEKKSYYIGKLKSFKGSAKYDQKKLAPILTAGIKAINDASSLDACKSAYTKYLAKAKATIKKYKVTTSKTGKGSVTSSKTVTYGSSVTIKLTPKAGHKISKVVVDGKKAKLKNSYKFTNIKKNHTVKVKFK